MATILGLHFNDFKNLSNNHRIYYFVGADYFDFLFIVEGILVKTTVGVDQIDNMQRFFSDKMFYGAIQLTFSIENPSPDLFSRIMGVKRPLSAPLNVEEEQDEEVKNEDIQREGISDGD